MDTHPLKLALLLCTCSLQEREPPWGEYETSTVVVEDIPRPRLGYRDCRELAECLSHEYGTEARASDEHYDIKACYDAYLPCALWGACDMCNGLNVQAARNAISHCFDEPNELCLIDDEDLLACQWCDA